MKPSSRAALCAAVWLAACGPESSASGGSEGTSSDDGATPSSDDGATLSPDDGSCTPGATEACECASGVAGQQACLDDGQLGACECDLACGDGVLESGEQCDDGNRDTGDGCDAQCSLESGVVRFDVEVGTLLLSELAMTSDGRIAVLRDDRTLASYDRTGEVVSTGTLPTIPMDLSRGGRGGLTALADGTVLAWFGGCWQLNPCDSWTAFDRDGAIQWEQSFWPLGTPGFRPTVAGGVGGNAVSYGRIWSSRGATGTETLQWYGTDGELELIVEPQRSVDPAWLREGPGGEILILDVPDNPGLTPPHVAAFDPEDGSLLRYVALPLGTTGSVAVASAERTYAVFRPDPEGSAVALQALDAEGDVVWSTALPFVYYWARIIALPDGRVLAAGLANIRLLTPDVLVISADGDVEAEHDLGGFAPLDFEVGPDGLVYLLIPDDPNGGAVYHLVALAP